MLFDLPTEAEWEYACRAGTTSALNSGNNLLGSGSSFKDANMDEVGRYEQNRSDGKGGYTEHTVVGKYLPNAWGLYDMHGNASERCLDIHHYGNAFTAVDPIGPQATLGSTDNLASVERGGAFNSSSTVCRSAYRAQVKMKESDWRVGFRVSCCISDN